MVGWHQQLNGHGFGWTPGVGDGQGGLACCSSWGRKSRTWLNDWTELNFRLISTFHNSCFMMEIMSIKSAMSSSHLILCHPFLLLPPILPSIRVFSNESTLHMKWPKYWSFSFCIHPSMNTQDWSPLGWTGWISLQSKGLSRVFSNTTVQKQQFFGAQPSSQSNSHIHTWPLEKP